MTRPRRRLALIALLVLAFGCNKDKPKPDETKKSEATPVPSNMVFNDFLPTTGGSGDGLGVRDAGLEGGLGAVGGPGEATQADAGTKVAVKLVEPGAEPRAVRKYTFVPNKVEKRVVTIAQSVSQTAGGQTAPPQEMTVKISVDLATKQVKPSGATVEAKVTKLEVPGAPPEAAKMLATMNGLSGSFEVTPSGEVGEVSFAGSPHMQNQLAEAVLGGISQAAQLLVAPLPTAPIGAGAKWELTAAAGEGEQSAKRFTLKEVSNDGGVVESEIELKMPRRAQQGPRGGTMFVEVEGKGKYTQTVRWNQVVPKADGEITVHEKIELNDPKAGKQLVEQTQKSHQTITTPGGK